MPIELVRLEVSTAEDKARVINAVNATILQKAEDDFTDDEWLAECVARHLAEIVKNYETKKAIKELPKPKVDDLISKGS